MDSRLSCLIASSSLTVADSTDAFSSSEAIGLGSSLMTKDQTIDVAKFALGPNCKVFSENLKEVKPGTGESGMVAVKGFLPVGYYKDQQKTDKTFMVIDGVRYSIPGDWVRVEDDGSLTLLGRGSNCINTAGEKVYPEEVEEALKGSDKAAIEAATTKLTEASSSLAQKMYAKQAEAAQPGADAEASSGGAEGNDDAVDAEFEEVKDEK